MAASKIFPPNSNILLMMKGRNHCYNFNSNILKSYFQQFFHTNLPILLHSSASEQTAPFLNWCNLDEDGGNGCSGSGIYFIDFFSFSDCFNEWISFCKYIYETNKTIKQITIRKNLYVRGKIFHHWTHDLKLKKKKKKSRMNQSVNDNNNNDNNKTGYLKKEID